MRRTLAAVLPPLLTSAGMVALASPTNAAVTVGENITAFPNRDMVGAFGYDLGEELTVQVRRNDVVVGQTTGNAVDTPEGIGLEVNHGPEGVTPLAGECWVGVTPDIVGGDVIRVITSRGSDEMTVADVDFVGTPYLDGTNVSIDGGGTTPTSEVEVEFRRDKPEPRFRRGPFPAVATGADTWKSTFRVSTTTSGEGLTPDQQRDIAINEADWAAVVDNVSSTTIAELNEVDGPAEGCSDSGEQPPVAPSVSPGSGTYPSTQSVTMGAAAGTVVRYTVGNGTTVPADPTTASTLYTGPITVETSRVIKAATFNDAGQRSAVTQRNYTINSPTTDTTAPRVTARRPVAGATGVGRGTNVTATFSENVTGIGRSTVTLQRAVAGSSPLNATVSYNAGTRVATLNPFGTAVTRLAANARYTATLTGGPSAIKDAAGNPLTTVRWSFTTRG